ncbi:spondin domain-containing protein [Congregibacter sp.]|uniref:spondin domain-containing protein n=1 Tax=Congregibacter sp. TaxID=2744308 RepID=UPI003F6D3CC9
MRYLYLPLIASVLVACGDSGGITTPPVPEPTPAPVTNAGYEVSVVNLTIGQPLSPVAVMLHEDSQCVFTIGQPASAGLELLAEGGDNGELLNEFSDAVTASGEAPVGPGASDMLSLEIEGDDTSGVRLSVATMLVNTNDAITGLNSIDISQMAVGDSLSFSAIAYDAGTEANSEAAGTIPGPADGGEGLNSARDDLADQVTMHAGVVTADDGLTGSVLNQNHRFDNPVARLRITRTQ